MQQHDYRGNHFNTDLLIHYEELKNCEKIAVHMPEVIRRLTVVTREFT